MKRIAGIDEAGRGAFAGPLVVACVVLDEKQEAVLKKQTAVFRDSKKMSELQRENTFAVLQSFAIQIYTCVISVSDINQHGIGWANYEGIKRVQGQACFADASFRRALHSSCDEIIVDGTFPVEKISLPGIAVQCMVDADATVFPVILAGIAAKVTRDRIMRTLDLEFPHYNWKKNKGYGTKFHRESIQLHGQSVHHRHDFIHEH